MSTDTIYMRRDGLVATITINNTAKKNALTVDMWKRLRNAVDDAERDIAIKVIVVTGEDDIFSAGADVEEINRSQDDLEFGEVAADAIRDAQRGLARNCKPTIAKMRGAAFGGGCGIALNCDLRFADPTARLAISPARLGLVYPLGDTKRLVELVGPGKAKDLLFTGRVLTAAEAEAFGLIDRMVAPAELDEAVYTFALQIAELSQFAIRASKRLIHMALDGIDEDDREARRLFVDSFSGADCREGAAAFVQKRKPHFPVA